MSVQYFAKVTNMQAIEVAVASTEEQAKSLRDKKFEPCSRTFYESKVRDISSAKPAGK